MVKVAKKNPDSRPENGIWKIVLSKLTCYREQIYGQDENYRSPEWVNLGELSPFLSQNQKFLLIN